MEKKIYIVTSGEYSDYRINAVFTTKEKAVDYVEQHGTDYNIEEYNLDEDVKKKTQLWNIVFCVENGKLYGANPTSYNKNKLIDTCSMFKIFNGKAEWHYINFYIDADSMDRAIKIASERFASVKANEYIWIRLTRPYASIGLNNKYERFNVKTNEFIKE